MTSTTPSTTTPYDGLLAPRFGRPCAGPVGDDGTRRGRRRGRRGPHGYAGYAGDPQDRVTTMSAEDDADQPRRRRGGHRHGRGGFGPGGFGPGGPGGPFGFGPGGPGGPYGFGPGFGRGGRARRGDVRAAVLSLLAEQPRHGYDLIQEIAARTEGRWRPSAGAVYPALAQLEDEGLVVVQEEEGRKVFHLTAVGREYVDSHVDELRAPWTAAAEGMPESAMRTFELARQVATALQEVLRTGTPEQIAAAQSLLSETRRSLYRILADDEPAT